MIQHGSAPGKIILTGEYAVVFGWPGIAVPAPLTITAIFEEDRTQDGIRIVWDEIKGDERWTAYLQDILNAIQQYKGRLLQGTLTIDNQIPLGKGMGSSTALVIAVSRCLLGKDCEREARAIEDRMNPGHSGIDFAVIWKSCPLLFKKGEDPQPIDLPEDLLSNAVLIDTGKPNESTSELVTWIKERENEVSDALMIIGQCTERLRSAAEVHESLLQEIIRDHHRAQVSLGVVPPAIQQLIADIEAKGGAAKVLGAGARTGGGGIVLVLQKDVILNHGATMTLTSASQYREDLKKSSFL
ncbi:MAG: hypothetical protein WCX61_03585 [Candidatus Peribacteraceae bacterium]|jgi:mevalonate kinase